MKSYPFNNIFIYPDAKPPPMRLLIFIILCFPMLVSNAQNTKTYRINSISNDSGNLRKSKYKYPDFKEGLVILVNQPTGTSLLNYNNLKGQFEFITPAGEVLELAKPETIKNIVIGTDTFYYSTKGWLEALTHYQNGNLLRSFLIKFNGTEKKGAYGTYVTTAAASSIKSVADETVHQSISVDENAVYASSVQYYISDKMYIFLPVNRKNFYKVFSSKQHLMAGYLQDHHVRFSNFEDLSKLIQFLHGQ